MPKCNISKETFCEAMETLAVTQHERGRKIYFATTVNMTSGETGLGVAYQYDSKNYAWLNYCPWCKGDLTKRKTAKAKKK